MKDNICNGLQVVLSEDCISSDNNCDKECDKSYIITNNSKLNLQKDKQY